MSKPINTTGAINKGFYCGKFLPPILQSALAQRIDELAKEDNKPFWMAYKKGIEIGVAEYKHERLKQLNKIKSRSDGLERTR